MTTVICARDKSYGRFIVSRNFPFFITLRTDRRRDGDGRGGVRFDGRDNEIVTAVYINARATKRPPEGFIRKSDNALEHFPLFNNTLALNCTQKITSMTSTLWKVHKYIIIFTRRIQRRVSTPSR